MRARSIVAIAVLVLAAAFFVLNWQVFSAATTVNFLVAKVEAPVGVVMGVLFALVLTVLGAYVGVWQSTLLSELKRQAREIESHRTLAENAEASRFTELGTLVRTEIEGLRAELRDTEHSIAATLAELDDRLHGSTPSVPIRHPTPR